MIVNILKAAIGIVIGAVIVKESKKANAFYDEVRVKFIRSFNKVKDNIYKKPVQGTENTEEVAI